MFVSLKIHTLKPRRWWCLEVGPWEVIRSWQWCPHEWEQSLQRGPLFLCRVGTWQQDGCLWTRKRALAAPNLLVPWSRTSQPLELWEINVFYLSHPLHGIFVMAAQKDKDSKARICIPGCQEGQAGTLGHGVKPSAGGIPSSKKALALFLPAFNWLNRAHQIS